MDVLKNKIYASYDYIARYSGIPYYYHTIDDREIFGLSKNMLKKNVSWVAHTVQPEDTLDKLALSYYNNPTYWWIIAYFNDIQDAFIRLKDYFDVIKIPAMTGLNFGDIR